MDFNLISKNNIGIIGTLILAIFLSQNRTMDFMFRTALGRLTLIVLILAMSYTNKILGVVGVLFVVIIFSSSGMNFMEGMEDPPATATTPPDNPLKVATGPSSDPPPNSDVPPPPPAEEPATTDPTSTAVQPKKKAASSATGTPIDEAQTGVTDQTSGTDLTTANAGDAISSTENAGVESFDILGLERNIQKGKNSNTIPIHNNNDYGNILPTDFGMGFNIGFSIF
jgi:hypothetical protein